MNLLIIGGSGFIGRNTVKDLRKYRHTVTIVDKVPPPEGFFTEKEWSGIQYWSIDILNGKSLPYKLQKSGEKYDAVYMFAAISDSKENHINIHHAINTNIMCLTNTLEIMEIFGIPKIIFSSTVWVYSLCKKVYVNEESNLEIDTSDHVYTTCKVACESIIRNYCNVRNLKYTILRYGIAYGPECHPDTVLSKFIRNAINGDSLIITGSGDIYRNFLYVTDHARGNRLALKKSADNQIINLEGPEKITLKRVAERVQELNGRVDITYTGARFGDYKGKNVSNCKAKKLLNWSPKVSFDKGSALLYEYILMASK